ncbi:HAMP domain-containing sensor histidine kinase [Caballeronia sp. LZ029]|uniref:sensor histidine kinase n=1 Tax=Caballeronia sp. LZ029 TaxID=3038564 RepID=UPI0028566EAF|nr:HAMP domain-containing sensor histidine kinase [Caballeronia sp. LZ029]MDR5748672.1 HAMP domain-containing sensor histidine kinase [Caballeronia sp. LZ029]
MLHTFLANNSDDLISRCRTKVAQRPARDASVLQLENGVPLFLEQLINTLRIEQTDRPADSVIVSGSPGGNPQRSEIGEAAAQHGHELLRLGYTVDQVVHDYGDLCQAITDLAHERDAPFSIDEFRTLNRCLDNAIADAVTEFSYQRDSRMASQQALEEGERMGSFAHELRNFLHTATLAFEAAKAGNLPLFGATGAVLDRSLKGLGKLIEHSIEDARRPAPDSAKWTLFSLSEFISETKHAANLAAQLRGCGFVVTPVDPQLAVSGNRDLLYSALGNLIQNAFKFTRSNTDVTLNAYAVADKILIEVKDHGGGLPPGKAEQMFLPFTQFGADKSGLGLGLSIARRSVELNDGVLSVRDIPGIGCVFTISLPRHALMKK